MQDQQAIINNVRDELMSRYGLTKEQAEELLNNHTPKELFRFYIIDCARVCDECGKWMDSGYYADGDYYCSDECLHHHYSQDEWLNLCDEDADYYYTEWY